ncbi:hypothetical protein SEA_CECE_254 [Microbacterium phage Cece]|nr:hypothetical protein SEA_CECE_254 [Microbacterium phage Cece]
MPRAKKVVPQDQGIYISVSEYMAHIVQDPSRLVVYIRSQQGIWYGNGVVVAESDLPADLDRLRLTQK